MVARIQTQTKEFECNLALRTLFRLHKKARVGMEALAVKMCAAALSMIVMANGALPAMKNQLVKPRSLVYKSAGKKSTVSSLCFSHGQPNRENPDSFFKKSQEEEGRRSSFEGGGEKRSVGDDPDGDATFRETTNLRRHDASTRRIQLLEKAIAEATAKCSKLQKQIDFNNLANISLRTSARAAGCL